MLEQENKDSHRIDQLSQYLKSGWRHDMGLLPRPFIVEFDGMPSCGKTTVIKELDKYFRYNGLRVFSPQEGAEVARHVARTSPEYNIRIVLSIAQIIIDMSWSHTYDIVLLDRGIFDYLCWTDYMKDKHMVTDEQADTLKRFYLLAMFTEKIDCAVVMICDERIALERERNLALSQKHGFTTVESLHEFYMRSFKLFANYAETYPQLQLLDTTALTPQEMIEAAKDVVLQRLSKKIKTA